MTSEKCVDPNAPIVPCAKCGQTVHTCEREIPEGTDYRCPAHGNGCQIWDGRWVCSQECYDGMHPESTCQKCGRENIIWFTTNEIWNAVNPSVGILCPICFVLEADKKGLNTRAWKLSLDLE